jgi:heterodisulfide reductase subunit C
MNIETSQPLAGESIPEFCTNKSCPISEFKIPKTPKIVKLAKKVVLRKVFFQNSVERWYCLKCMKAHNDC